MARNYTLDKNSATGFWRWGCKDGPKVGMAPSKHEARKQAKAACKGNAVITPPNVDVIGIRGYLSSFTVEALDGTSNEFSAEEINQKAFSFFFGMPCAKEEKIEDAEKLITILKIWGIYRGGLNIKTIMKIHNMSTDDAKN